MKILAKTMVGSIAKTLHLFLLTLLLKDLVHLKFMLYHCVGEARTISQVWRLTRFEQVTDAEGSILVCLNPSIDALSH